MTATVHAMQRFAHAHTTSQSAIGRQSKYRKSSVTISVAVPAGWHNSAILNLPLPDGPTPCRPSPFSRNASIVDDLSARWHARLRGCAPCDYIGRSPAFVARNKTGNENEMARPMFVKRLMPADDCQQSHGERDASSFASSNRFRTQGQRSCSLKSNLF